MKRSFTGVLTLLAGAGAVCGQGTVSFGNYGSTASAYLYVSYKPLNAPAQLLGGEDSGPVGLPIYDILPAYGNFWDVEVYGAAGAGDPTSELLPLGSIATFANGVTDSTPGTWLSTAILTIPGTFAGQIATVQLYAWYNPEGYITSYSEALAFGLPAGCSVPANVTLGGSNPDGTPSIPSQLPFSALGNFEVSVVPEPSTRALGVLGAFVLIVRLRERERGVSPA